MSLERITRTRRSRGARAGGRTLYDATNDATFREGAEVRDKTMDGLVFFLKVDWRHFSGL